MSCSMLRGKRRYCRKERLRSRVSRKAVCKSGPPVVRFPMVVATKWNAALVRRGSFVAVLVPIRAEPSGVFPKPACN